MHESFDQSMFSTLSQQNQWNNTPRNLFCVLQSVNQKKNVVHLNQMLRTVRWLNTAFVANLQD